MRGIEGVRNNGRKRKVNGRREGIGEGLGKRRKLGPSRTIS